jgi:hypothetical protein
MKRFVTVGVGVLVLLAAIIATATSLFTLRHCLSQDERKRSWRLGPSIFGFAEAAAKAFHQLLPPKRPAPRKARDSSARNAARATEIVGIIPRMPAGGCTRVPPT